ncbi:hypothetical protein M422DRAFT_262607 [Sphaerobolus stellatus SS14]|uniref:Uncharacterized protein n=1 Tax=Sphaerobolus stellatus (strain SS14) TaxID=990650 RepID=A0A0C9VCW4_SPHS4|nr:hypothetical protein M422DRAFT_262607 [Sphaerobolus stellatus SS14]
MSNPGIQDYVQDHSLQISPAIASPVHYFTPKEISQGKNEVTSHTVAVGISTYPLNVVVEYLETSVKGIAHQFQVNPEPDKFLHPKENLQYSLGGTHGMSNRVQCRMLPSNTGSGQVPCKVLRTQCLSIKYCEFYDATSTSDASILQSTSHEAECEDFLKTLALFAVLQEKGCCFSDTDTLSMELDDSGDFSEDIIDGVRYHDVRSPERGSLCKGEIGLYYNSNGAPFLACKNFSAYHRAHFHLRRLDEYDIEYLTALFRNDITEVARHETNAKDLGYGPLIPCTFVASCREQKQLCINLHRDFAGRLRRGELLLKEECPVRFIMYQPWDLANCPYVLIYSQGDHNHSDPRPTKTPLAIRQPLEQWLQSLDWQLADATPRRILLNPEFMGNLRDFLNGKHAYNPSLSALHPSLENKDHVQRFILELRHLIYPNGTGFEGVKCLAKQHEMLPKEEQYLRFAGTVQIPRERPFHLVICMSAAMSRLLVKARRISIDTSFKRAVGWEEFEIETWDDIKMHSVTCSRVFISSQSAEAHQILFSKIFEIANADTAEKVCFRYIHGQGIETVVADAHKGQALGLAKVCVNMCHHVTRNCHYHSDDSDCKLNQMSLIQHLAHFFIQCINHYERKIKNLGDKISVECRRAMHSLASTSPVPDFEANKDIIRRDSKSARDWLQDKEVHQFMFPALYFPLSKMPLTIWQASPHTSNGNEQAHRTINRDGIKMALLAAVVIGYHRDFDNMSTSNPGLLINSRDRLSTHYARKQLSIVRNVRVAKRKVEASDNELLAIYAQIDELTPQILLLAQKLEEMDNRMPEFDIHSRELQQLDLQYQEVCSEAQALAKSSSGQVELRNLATPTFYAHLIGHLPPLFQPGDQGGEAPRSKKTKVRKPRASQKKKAPIDTQLQSQQLPSQGSQVSLPVVRPASGPFSSTLASEPHHISHHPGTFNIPSTYSDTFQYPSGSQMTQAPANTQSD